MTALIDWSYDLLTPREQRFFEHFSVFAAGCTLEAATAVCATDEEDDLDVIDLIESLVTKSLLVAEQAGNEQRYYLLESSRQYASAKLIARGEQERTARRHALFCVELAERLESSWGTAPEPVWLSQAHVELGNWRAALQWMLTKRGDVILGQRLAAARKVIGLSFPGAEARRWIGMALELVDEFTPPLLVARLEHAEAAYLRQLGERKLSLAAAQRALTRYRQLGDVTGTTQAQILAGEALVSLGRPSEGELLLTEALHSARTLDDRPLIAYALSRIGLARSRLGDFAESRAQLTEALELANVLGAQSFAATFTLNLAANEFDAGAPETALLLIRDVLTTHGKAELDTDTMTTALLNMADCLVALGRYDEARVPASEALEIGCANHLTTVVAGALHHLALATALRPQVEGRRTLGAQRGVARILGFVDARRDALGIEGLCDLTQEYGRAIALLRDAFGADDLAHLMGVGATMTEDEAIAQAQALE